MPKEWKDCVKSVKESGKSQERAYAICTEQFKKKHGITPQEADKRGWLEEIFETLSLEDLELLDEKELAAFAKVAEEDDLDASELAWIAPLAREDVSEKHFFCPEQKKYPYRNPDGSVNYAGVMAVWEVAQGDKSLAQKVEPYYGRCLKKKAGEDVNFDDIYERNFVMPDTFFEIMTDPELKLEDEEETSIVKIQALRKGVFKHPQYGKIKFDDKTFSSFIKNFESRVPQEHIAYDFKHRPDWGAAAWLKRLYVEGDGLWADVELTKRGAESLKNREFIYFSTEYVDDYKDRETGKSHGPAILGGGLTNRPFIKGMAPTLMSEENEEVFVPVEDSTPQKEVKENMNEILKEIASLREELNGMIEKAQSKEDVQMAFSTVGEQIKALEEKLDEARKADVDAAKALEEVQEALKTADEEKKSLTESLESALREKESQAEELKKHKEAARQKDVEIFCKELSEKGIFPATVEVMKEYLLAGSEETVITLSEGEGEEKKDVEVDLKGIFTRIIESIPEEFKVSMSEDTEHGEKDTELTVEKIEKLAEEEGVSYNDMLIKLSKEKKI